MKTMHHVHVCEESQTELGRVQQAWDVRTTCLPLSGDVAS